MAIYGERIGLGRAVLLLDSPTMMDRLSELLEPYSTVKGSGIDAMGPLPFLVVLSLSLACGLIIAILYRRFYGERETGSQIQRAFPLLSLAITAIFICIQFSLPLSLGLLGALSIVRFRTPVKEPEEIGFLMVVIATSLACATFNFKFLGVILILTLVALVLQELLPSLLRGGPSSGVILVAVPQEEYAEKKSSLFETLETRAPKGRLESISRDRDEILVTYSFRRLEPAGAADLQEELGKAIAASHVTLSYDRGGGI